MMRALLAVALVAFLSACTSPGEVKGTVDGHTLEVASAVFSPFLESEIISLLLSEADDICEDISTGTRRKNAARMWFLIARQDGSTDSESNALPLIPGEYPLFPFRGFFETEFEGDPPAQAAIGEFAKDDNQCNAMLNSARSIIQSGSLRIEKVSYGNELSGTFDVRVGEQGDRLTGRFDAIHCEVLKGVSTRETCK